MSIEAALKYEDALTQSLRLPVGTLAVVIADGDYKGVMGVVIEHQHQSKGCLVRDTEGHTGGWGWSELAPCEKPKTRMELLREST